jgi:hypothetical protein
MFPANHLCQGKTLSGASLINRANLPVGSEIMEIQPENQIPTDESGMDRLVEKYRRQFRISENLDYYSERDYHRAERDYLRFCLSRGAC